VPDYRNEVSVDAGVPVLAERLGMAMLDTLDYRTAVSQDSFAPAASANATADPYTKAGWGRVIGASGSVSGVSYRLGGFQLGFDVYRGTSERDVKNIAGLYLGAGRIDSDIDSFNPNGGVAGHVDMNAYSAGIYWTRYTPQGFYTDAVLQGTSYGHVRADSVNTANNQSFRPNGWGAMASLEGGYKIGFEHGWALTPQAQLIYQHLSFEGGQDDYGSIDYRDVNGGYGRIGAKLSKDWISDYQPRRFTLWVRGNLWQALGTQGETAFSSLSHQNPVSFKTNLGETWFDLGVGITGRLAKHVLVFATGDVNISVDGKNGHEVAGRIGMKIEL
jgi:outer membrane autotransporter protein